MIDYTDRDQIFHAIKQARTDNPALFTLAQDIAKHVRAINKAHDATNALLVDAIQVSAPDESRLPLSANATDSDIRARARLLLMDKLNDGSITASEFGQFKDVFGLASAQDELSIETVDFRSMCDDCPLGRAPIVPELPAA